MFILTITYFSTILNLFIIPSVQRMKPLLCWLAAGEYIPSLARSIIVSFLVGDQRRKQSHPWPRLTRSMLLLIPVNMVQLVASRVLVLWCLFGMSATDDAWSAKPKTYQPVDVGFQFSTPVNLANTLQNSVAGPLSVALVVAFAGILVAGLFRPKVSSVWTSRSSDDER